MTEQETVFFDGPESFENWLEQHEKTAADVWIKMAKKHTGIPSLDWARAVEVALCFGWIDGQSRRIDDDWYLQRFTPRRPKSTWSKINREKVQALTDAGRMRPAGLAEVERAKADGRWEAAYDSVATASVPEDLARALDDARVSEMFASLDSRNRYAILHRVQTAGKPETRARRIAKYVAMLKVGEKPYP
ncbi:MAG TPA: YdeI/OmpD-associated family protein [Gaiellaceae bacterium]|nr:YdeI/OmpD-associated family protein [Gaiellaceae bacterium]